MKTKIIYSTITCLALLAAAPAPAQFHPVDPVPFKPMPPIDVGPITTFTPSNLEPITPVSPTNTEPNEPTGSSGGNTDTEFSRSFVVAVCIGTEELTDDCLSHGEQEATKRLIDFYLREFAKEAVKDALTLRFPKFMSETEQLRELAKIEKTAVEVASKKISDDLGKLIPLHWDSEQDRLDKVAVMLGQDNRYRDWWIRASYEASHGTNWSHEWSTSTHRFNKGTAYRQLQHIVLHGWGGT
jgi:hypothetical protein